MNSVQTNFLNFVHCVKSVQIRSFFWSVFSCIRTVHGDLRSKNKPEKTPYLDTFHAVATLKGNVATEHVILQLFALVVFDSF